MSLRYRFGVVTAAVFVLLAYKALTIAPLGFGPIALGWLLETALLYTWWGLFEIRRTHESKILRRSLATLFYALFYTIVIVSIAHTFFFESAAERRISLLEIDLRTLGFFFTNILPLRGLFLMLGMLVAIHALAYPIARITRSVDWVWRMAGIGVLWTVVGIWLTVSPRPPSPFADMGADLWEQLTTPEIDVDRTKPARFAAKELDKSGTLAPFTTRFKKVLVFVMETMTSETFKQESKLLPNTAFVNRIPTDAHVYGHYFSTNQDSRTGMLAMLGSRFIPFEAYTEEGRDHYLKLGHKSSLADLFKQNGYRTAFAVSQREIELVVGDLSWDQIIHFEPADIEKLDETYLCFVPYEFEHSCEDRALLDRVLAFVDRDEPVFLYQEFIWGHAAEYNKASGRTTTDYYSAYLDSVIAHLEQTGKLDETLIVLTSDHGFRDKGVQGDVEVYHIPLWFYTRGMQARRDDRLFSHLDFKRLLLAELAEQPPPEADPFVMIEGPTGTSFVTVVTQPGQFLLMKAREGERYLMKQNGFQDGDRARREASSYMRLFEDYLTYFESL